jgi:hypothetical protein
MIGTFNPECAHTRLHLMPAMYHIKFFCANSIEAAQALCTSRWAALFTRGAHELAQTQGASW